MNNVDKKLLRVKSNLTEVLLNKWKFCYAVVLPGKFQSLFIQTLKFLKLITLIAFGRFLKSSLLLTVSLSSSLDVLKLLVVVGVL